MTFTQYLRHLVALGLKPSFQALLDHPHWPDTSTRLEEYETLIWHLLGLQQRALALLELQTLWSRWVDGPATSARLDADHALLAWRDYALHMETCELADEGLCPRAAELLDRAIDESHFDLDSLPDDPIPCESPDEAEARRQRELAAEDVLGLADVEAILQKHRDRRLTPSRPTSTPKQ